MPKRRRLLNTLPSAEKMKQLKKEPRVITDEDVWSARGRLKGALMEVLEPTAEESDQSSEDGEDRHAKVKREMNNDLENGDKERERSSSPPRQSYVLKLFDRSVDLSQFKEDSPLYPVCRAWILNQPRVIYSELGAKEDENTAEEGVKLPPPEGEPISRVPALLPEQLAASKDNINLNYETSLPSREQLLQSHVQRWSSVRDAWLKQAQLCETRYSAAQEVLNQLHVSSM